MTLDAREAVRLTTAQAATLAEAARLRRKRTGDAVRVSDLLREGARLVCEGEGLTWPDAPSASGEGA